jgi:multicomponent Na+:H+ antiporter subunit D
MLSAQLPSFVLFYLGALIIAWLPGERLQRLRGAILLLVPVSSGLLLWVESPETTLTLQWMDLQLTPYRADRLALLFASLFHVAALIGFIFALHVRNHLQQVAAMLYVASALGAVFAGDFLTLFVHWEMLALTSVFLILARQSERAMKAGLRYLIVQVLSGVLILAGGAMLYLQTGSLEFGFVGLNGMGSWLLLLGFGIKAGFPLLHSWLVDAYPEATPTGTVLLSAFTTKVAIYALARGFPGTELLVYVGAVMTCFPIFYAVIENDLRRVLAYSMINQLGFMVCGIGIGTTLALNGAVAHAVNDVIFKGLLFMAMGAVLHKTGRINGSDLGGLYKTMPKTTALCIVGAASISAFPLFSGFVSKSMIITALLQEYRAGADHYQFIWLALLFASAGVFHHAGIKIPYFAFFGHDSGIRTTEPPLNMLLAMSLAAFLCIAIGCFPQVLYGLLPWPVDYSPYDLSHVLTQLQLLCFAAVAFAWLNIVGLYPPELHSVNLDVDWLYRRWALQRLRNLERGLVSLWQRCMQRVRRNLFSLIELGERSYSPGGRTAPKPTSDMLLWVALLLMLFVILSNI